MCFSIPTVMLHLLASCFVALFEKKIAIGGACSGNSSKIILLLPYLTNPQVHIGACFAQLLAYKHGTKKQAPSLRRDWRAFNVTRRKLCTASQRAYRARCWQKRLLKTNGQKKTSFYSGRITASMIQGRHVP